MKVFLELHVVDFGRDKPSLELFVPKHCLLLKLEDDHTWLERTRSSQRTSRNAKRLKHQSMRITVSHNRGMVTLLGPPPGLQIHEEHFRELVRLGLIELTPKGEIILRPPNIEKWLPKATKAIADGYRRKNAEWIRRKRRQSGQVLKYEM